MALKENYKDDILDVSVNTKRKYRMTENADGTISLDDETVYTQEGDSFGSGDINAITHAVNNVATDAEHTSYDNTESGLESENVQGAIDEINDNLTNLGERIELMNFEYFDVRMLAQNASQGYNLNPNKITYISLVSQIASNGYGVYKVENGTLTHISGERYTSYLNLSGNVLTITNPSSYVGVTVAY